MNFAIKFSRRPWVQEKALLRSHTYENSSKKLLHLPKKVVARKGTVGA